MRAFGAFDGGSNPPGTTFRTCTIEPIVATAFRAYPAAGDVFTVRSPSATVTLTVHDIRNGIRSGVGRFKRETTATFTKEELAALADALDVPARHRSTNETTRAAIRAAVGVAETPDEADGGSFSKSELRAIADALDVDPVEGDEPEPLY